MFVRWVQVNGARVMDERAHAGFGKCLTKGVTVRHGHDEQVIDVAPAFGLDRKPEGGICERLEVERGKLAAASRPLVDVWELRDQDCRLDCVQPAAS